MTIGGSDLEPEGIGTFVVQITDYNSTASKITLNNYLYFPASSVNIISIAYLGDFYKVNRDIFIKITGYSSYFTWNVGKYTKLIQHTHVCIPEIEVTLSFSKWSTFTTAVNLFTHHQHHKCYNLNIEDYIHLKVA